MYCPKCGKEIKDDSVFCPYCGNQIKNIEIKPQQNQTIYPKSKAVSVTLAVFFGFWSWLYTYKIDQLKFWIFLGILITMMVFYVSYACSSIGATLENPYNFDMAAYEQNIGNFATWIWAVNVIGWLWALIDSIRRPLNFFISYPYNTL
jgi:hypothetical protein